MQKNARYRELVVRCRSCRLCGEELENSGDPDHPSPWARLFGSLDADLIVVGRDFSARDRQAGPNRIPDLNILTNKNLRKLIAEAKLPPDKVYLTNAILCLKPGKYLNGPTRAAWFTSCRSLLRETIDIIAPRAVVALGTQAWDSLQRAYELQPVKLASAVDGEPRQVCGGPTLHARYHCGSLGLLSRSFDHQLKDWQKLGESLRRN